MTSVLLILQSQKSIGPTAAPTVQPNQVETQNATSNPTLAGVARVIDGDTISIHGTHIRLDGIDAPETKQTCEVNDNPCGLEATEALIKTSFIAASTSEKCQDRK